MIIGDSSGISEFASGGVVNIDVTANKNNTAAGGGVIDMAKEQQAELEAEIDVLVARLQKLEI